MSIRQLTTQDGRVVHLRHSTPTIYSWDDGTLVDTTADDIPITFGVTGHCKRWFANGVILSWQEPQNRWTFCSQRGRNGAMVG